jgi:hypothetical protein
MLRFLAGASIHGRSRELISKNRRPLLLAQPFAAAHVLSDEHGSVGHHAVASFRTGIDRRGGSALVVARARGRHGWVTPNKTQQPRLLLNDQRQRDGDDTCSSHAGSRHSHRAKRRPIRTARRRRKTFQFLAASPVALNGGRGISPSRRRKFRGSIHHRKTAGSWPLAVRFRPAQAV